MTDPRKEPVRAYLRQLADLMGLLDWEVRLLDDPSAEGSLAQVHIPYGRKVAIVRVSEEFLDDGEDDRRHTIVHELIHCHLDSACKQAKMGMEEKVFDQWMLGMEHGVDALASALAPWLPTMEQAKDLE